MRFCCHSGKSVGWKNNKHCHLHKNMTLYMFDWCRRVVQNSTLQSHCIKNGQKKWLRKVMMLSERRTKQDRKRKKLRKQDRKWERKWESETNENAERSRTRGETMKNNYVDNLTWSFKMPLIVGWLDDPAGNSWCCWNEFKTWQEARCLSWRMAYEELDANLSSSSFKIRILKPCSSEMTSIQYLTSYWNFSVAKTP